MDTCPMCGAAMRQFFCTALLCPLGGASPFHPDNSRMSVAEAMDVLGLTTSTPAGHDVVEGPDDAVNAAEPEPPKFQENPDGHE